MSRRFSEMLGRIGGRQSAFITDAFFSGASFGLPVLVGMVALPVILNNLEADQFVLFSMALALIAFAPSLDFGVSRAALRHVAINRGSDGEVVWGLVGWLRHLSTGVASLTSILGFGFLSLFWVRNEVEFSITLSVACVVGVWIAIFANVERAILEGLDRFSTAATNRSLVGSFFLGTPAILSFMIDDVALLAASAVAARIPFLFFQSHIVTATLHSKYATGGFRPYSNKRILLRESSWYALLAISAIFMSGLDRYVYSLLAGLSQAELAALLGPQEIALRLISVPAAIVPALLVRMSQADHGQTSRRTLVEFLTLTTAPIFLITLCGVIFASELHQWLFPSLGPASTVWIIKILCIGVFANSAAHYAATHCFANDQVHAPALMHLLQLPVFIAMSIFLVGRYGSEGAAASWTGRILIDVVLLISWFAIQKRAPFESFTQAIILLSGTAILLTLAVT